MLSTHLNKLEDELDRARTALFSGAEDILINNSYKISYIKYEEDTLKNRIANTLSECKTLVSKIPAGAPEELTKNFIAKTDALEEIYSRLRYKDFIVIYQILSVHSKISQLLPPGYIRKEIIESLRRNLNIFIVSSSSEARQRAIDTVVIALESMSETLDEHMELFNSPDTVDYMFPSYRREKSERFQQINRIIAFSILS